MLHNIPHLIKLETPVPSNKKTKYFVSKAAIIKYKLGVRNKKNYQAIIQNCIPLCETFISINGNLEHLHTATLLEVISHILKQHHRYEKYFKTTDEMGKTCKSFQLNLFFNTFI